MHVMTQLIRNRARCLEQKDVLIQALVELVTDPTKGGLQGLIAGFAGIGMEDIARSWIGSSENKRISSEGLESVLGSSTFDTLAEQANIPRDMIAPIVAELLPEIVNRLTPQNSLSEIENAEDILPSLIQHLSAA